MKRSTRLIVVGSIAAAVVWGSRAGDVAQNTNRAGKYGFYNGPFSAGLATNGVQAILMCFPESEPEDIYLGVQRTDTNRSGLYVKPPDGGFAKIELRGADGKMLAPTTGKVKLVTEWPRVVDVSRLPHRAEGLFHGGGVRDILLIGRGAPTPLREFRIYDAFDIERDGEYTLTIWPSFHQVIEPGEKVAQRVDLPPVSVKLHLVAAGAQGARKGP